VDESKIDESCAINKKLDNNDAVSVRSSNCVRVVSLLMPALLLGRCPPIFPAINRSGVVDSGCRAGLLLL
jgi:hypothetical protein